MPPGLPSYDAVVASVVRQWWALTDEVQHLPSESFDLPTRLGTWRVAELVAHLFGGVHRVVEYLALDPPPRPEVDVLTWPTRTRSAAADVDERARMGAAEARPAELRAYAQRSVAETVAALDPPPDPKRVLAYFLGGMTLSDFLMTRCVEATVHALDLAAATTRQPVLDQGALRVAVRVLALSFAAATPGKSVELRIPGAAGTAVQCVEGPRHTRGTPPNVVETAAATWLELATGRLSWGDGVAAGRISASGERADLSRWLPLLG